MPVLIEEFKELKCGIYVMLSNKRVSMLIRSYYEIGNWQKKIAEKIAEKEKVSLETVNFGGVSGGNPPILKKVFVVPLKERELGLGAYLKPKSEEIKEEMERIKQKLIKVFKKFKKKFK